MTDFAESCGVTLTVDSQEQLEIELDRAVDQAIRDALTEGAKGILVSRRNSRAYTVELSTEVPLGQSPKLNAI